MAGDDYDRSHPRDDSRGHRDERPRKRHRYDDVEVPAGDRASRERDNDRGHHTSSSRSHRRSSDRGGDHHHHHHHHHHHRHHDHDRRRDSDSRRDDERHSRRHDRDDGIRDRDRDGRGHHERRDSSTRDRKESRDDNVRSSTDKPPERPLEPEAGSDDEDTARIAKQIEQLEEEEQEDEEARIARRRAERKALAEKLRAKHAAIAPGGTAVPAASSGPPTTINQPAVGPTMTSTDNGNRSDSDGEGQLGEKDLFQDSTVTQNSVQTASGTDDADGADFDEMGHRKREIAEHEQRVAAALHKRNAEAQAEKNQKAETDDGGLDMFSASPIVPVKPDGGAHVRGGGDNMTLNDNWDDREGYYTFRNNEVIAGRFLVVESMGRGVFSSVVRALDQQNNDRVVCIKIIRANETMATAAQKEILLLERIRDKDPDNKKHVVRIYDHFEYRNHLCLVFEPLAMNLRQVLRKYGRARGLNIKAVRWYTKQLFVALKHLQQCNIMHADLKLDNILVDSNMSLLKVCDFGSASEIQENEATPYLVSRFYRAPEIIVGLKYDNAIDMWSAGCCIYELYTGKILFPGKSNNEMLKGFMDVRGFLPKKMIRRGQFHEQHFDHDCNFLMNTEDPYTKKPVVKVLSTIDATRSISDLLTPTINPDEPRHRRHVTQLIDLLDKIFTPDPAKRLTPEKALDHPFVKEHA